MTIIVTSITKLIRLVLLEVHVSVTCTITMHYLPYNIDSISPICNCFCEITWLCLHHSNVLTLENLQFILLNQLRQEKCELEETLEKEQEYQVNKLMRRIEKLQADVVSKQTTLEQVCHWLSLFFLTISCCNFMFGKLFGICVLLSMSLRKGNHCILSIPLPVGIILTHLEQHCDSGGGRAFKGTKRNSCFPSPKLLCLIRHSMTHIIQLVSRDV